jgi:hypothetical protein
MTCRLLVCERAAPVDVHPPDARNHAALICSIVIRTASCNPSCVAARAGHQPEPEALLSGPPSPSASSAGTLILETLQACLGSGVSDGQDQDLTSASQTPIKGVNCPYRALAAECMAADPLRRPCMSEVADRLEALLLAATVFKCPPHNLL